MDHCQRSARTGRRWILLVALAGMWIPGCGGDGLDRVPIVGKVTLGGEPLGGAVLSFIPAANTPGDGALGIADETGTFEVISSRKSDKGIPAGSYTVRVSRRVLFDGTPLPPDLPEADVPDSRESVPLPYSSIDSPLTVVIPEGGGDLHVDIPLES